MDRGGIWSLINNRRALTRQDAARARGRHALSLTLYILQLNIYIQAISRGGNKSAGIY